MRVEIGKEVPALEFELTEQQGKHSFTEFLGKKVVLYFYPKDDTPGCTLEAQGFRDHLAAFHQANAVVLGVSKDSCASHQKFLSKYSLNFDLIADTEGTLCSAFDVIKEKNMYGRKYLGIERSTFVLDEAGILVRAWRKVSVPKHVEEVLNFIRGLS